ncbi:MAG: hypothetical protein ACOYUZ_05150 [Patescibacteria group bacterium]
MIKNRNINPKHKFFLVIIMLVVAGSAFLASFAHANVDTEVPRETPRSVIPSYLIPAMCNGPGCDLNEPVRDYVADSREYQRDLNDFYYENKKVIMQKWQFQLQLAVLSGVLDVLGYYSQQFAYQTAEMILTGGDSGYPMFYADDFGSWLKNTVDTASGVFFDSAFKHMQQVTDANSPAGMIVNASHDLLCGEINPIAFQLSLAFGDTGLLSPGTCTLSKIADNFTAVSDLVSSGDAIKIHEAKFTPTGDDLAVGLDVNNRYIDQLLTAGRDAVLERNESEGMLPILGKIDDTIKWPSVLANDSIQKNNPQQITIDHINRQEEYMIDAFWQAGLESIAWLSIRTFGRHLLFGILQKLFEPDDIAGATTNSPDDLIIKFEMLQNADASGEAQDLYERKQLAKALGDFVIPNFSARDDLDILQEMSVCPAIRNRWNCAIDTALMATIYAGTKDGAITVGRAAGVGSENASYAGEVQGLHPDWELIPESDIKNNTDPSCYQRAYCAGNLKKLRLARIIPIGWEMAANSPFNIKKDGKYITLGEVIRGFHNCNDDGKLDVDHPWCHLIDPGWILNAPAYQCRTRGYGDALIPQVGDRMEDCGDIVSCLSTNQKGECVGGYGYCLAERPVYRFEAQECEAQFASCRTYQYDGGQLSALRYTVERGKCSEESVGCMWFATNRYVTSTASPDGLWVGTVTSGPRVYLDGTRESCSAEGCTRVYKVTPGQPALNLVANSSFESVITDDDTGDILGVNNWNLYGLGTCTQFSSLTESLTADYRQGGFSILLKESGCDYPARAEQLVEITPNQNYTFSYYSKNPDASPNGDIELLFGYLDELTGDFIELNGAAGDIAFYQDCNFGGGGLLRLRVGISPAEAGEWQHPVCQFASPVKATHVLITLTGAADGINFDQLQLEAGEVATDFVEGVNPDLPAAYLKIAPDEYNCTGDDANDHPSCKNFARRCTELDVGCQGYTDIEDPTAPEIPAKLSDRDKCPGFCAGYGEYRKLASAFDLVQNPAEPEFNDPDDETVAYFIPNLAEECSLSQVGCEAFTNMESAAAGGEQVSHYNYTRSCEKPNDLTQTYFTWEGSDAEGYQLYTWALIASSTTDKAPKLLLKGAQLGDIKDPKTCNEITWQTGSDLDCRQFYDDQGQVYYRYFSQTVASDASCTVMRKDDSTEADCNKTGGFEFIPQNKSCLYNVLPSASSICSASAGGCRAFLGPTGRNVIRAFETDFKDDAMLNLISSNANTSILQSDESVLVGDKSIRLEPAPGQGIQAEFEVPLLATSSLFRVSFWAKSEYPQTAANVLATVAVDGNTIGSFAPDIRWQRFEFGPFYVVSNPMKLVISGPAQLGSVFLDTMQVDELHDTRFIIKNSWSVPAACDATPEGIPEPRAMLGCRAYNDRDGNTAYVRQFSNLCNEDAIGCKAFVDTRGMPRPYKESYFINGTEGASLKSDGLARLYEEQYIGSWNITSKPYRYYYAIDDERGRCAEDQNSCRAFGRPVFSQDRLSLAATSHAVLDTDLAVYQNQQNIFAFETVLLKDEWDRYFGEQGQTDLACRKDELHCNRFISGNVTEYFRDPGNHTCFWQTGKALKANPSVGIYTDGEYKGWFRDGTDTPCYPGSISKSPYQKNGDEFGIYFNGEDQYSGWAGKCPVDQSECTEFVDPNDSSNADYPDGRPYYLINSSKLDTRSCSGQVDPLSGCILFNNKSVPQLFASSKATYAKVMDEQGAPQSYIDCEGDPDNVYCAQTARCADFDAVPNQYGQQIVNKYNESIAPRLAELQEKIKNQGCQTDADCEFTFRDYPNGDAVIGSFVGRCVTAKNDANIVLKVNLDRECARWMGCRTGETLYDAAQQKFVNQCTDLELCERNGSNNEDIFCSQFVNRNTEDFFKEGQFISLEKYSARQIYFGAMDYSGFTVPNQYLLPDIKPRSVAKDLLPPEASMSNRYEDDVRLTAKIPMKSDDVDSYTDVNFTGGVNLCQDSRTKRIGYVVKEADGDYCILAINEPQALSVSVGGQALDTDLSRDIQQIYSEFVKGNVSQNNANVQSAMPAPECQLYPEATSPLPNQYVAKWSTAFEPPIPEEMAEGYENANACVYGEDCSCSYRKVRYDSGDELYYSVKGAAPLVGICVGGTNAGKACVPGGYIPVDNANRVLVSGQTSTGLESVVSAACGGGYCAAIQDVVVQNGRYGYCLERDRTRAGDVSQTSAPCLTWSPQAVLGGRYDLSHFSPTAGYMPPQGSGEYYCVSGGNEQKLEAPDLKTYWGDVGTVRGGSNFWNPGNLYEFAFSRSDVWYYGTEPANAYDNISIDGARNRFIGGDSNVDCINLVVDNPETSKVEKPTRPTQCDEGDNVKAHYTQNMRFACRRASLCEGYITPDTDGWERPDANDNEGRWIMTGNSISNSYMEYFIPFGLSLNQPFNEKYFDYRYGLFKFSISPYAVGSACKWNPRWLGMSHVTADLSPESTQFSCQGYLQQIQQNSQQFVNQFNQQFPGVLDRQSEKILRNSEGVPVKLECALGGGECFYKYWEAGFNDGGQEAFTWPEKTHKDKLGQFNFRDQFRVYYAHECTAGKPFFSIRAMFQNLNWDSNRLSADEAKNLKLDGPWQFVGFWITTCLPPDYSKSAQRFDPGWLYMRLDIVKADVCQEVGQVVAPYTRESAAFADRVWAEGKFFLPVIGVEYASRNEPFGSALATGAIGNDPMLVGASVPISADVSSAPTFIDSGVTVQSLFNRQNAWAPLSNIFARVYKVWRWDPIPVHSWDWACVSGSKKGKICTVNASKYQGLVDCSDYATCDPDISVNEKNQNWRCNTLSGVNRGLHCGDETVPARNVDPVCHNAPVAWKEDKNTGQLQTKELYGACKKIPNAASVKLSTGQYGMSGHSGGLCDTWNGSYDQKYDITLNIATGPSGQYFVPALIYLNDNGFTNYGNKATPYVAVWAILKMQSDLVATGQSGGGLQSQGNFRDILVAISKDANLRNKFYDAAELVLIKNNVSKVFGQNETTSAFTRPDSQAGFEGLMRSLYFVWSIVPETTLNEQLAALSAYDKGVGCTQEIIPSPVSDDYWRNSIDGYMDLGAFNQDFNILLGGFQCDTGSVRAGEACREESANSIDCPREIKPCNTYQTDADGWPTCGHCTVNDPDQKQKDQYWKLYPGTGYCEGFNPLARCRSNNDCTFNKFEHWGAYDEGGAQGKLIEIKQDLKPVFSGSDPEWVKPGANLNKTVRLPRPLFNSTDNKVPDNYSEPATLALAGSAPGNYLDEFQSMYTGADDKHLTKVEAYAKGAQTPYCADKAWHNVCYSMLRLFSWSGWEGETADWVTRCENYCRTTMRMYPNSYAKNFDIIALSTANQKRRTAAVAPFAVDPSIRNLLSHGFIFLDIAGDEHMDMDQGRARFYRYYFGGNPLGSPYNSILTDLAGWSLDEFSGWASVFTGVLTEEESPAYFNAVFGYLKRLNDSFPWRADKLYFTTVFPLAAEGAYNEPEGYEIYWNSQSPNYLKPFEKYWEGFGMSRDLFEIASKYMENKEKDKTFSTTYDTYREEKDYANQAANDMQDNFFSKTGWGSFYEPDDPDLALYPGAIPAAIPKQTGDYRDKYHVYIPGHCEPPPGGTDSDSIDGELVNVILPNQSNKWAALGLPDSFWASHINAAFNVNSVDETGPDLSDNCSGCGFNDRGLGSVDGIPFVMPWPVNNENILETFLTEEYFHREANNLGTTKPEKYTWIQPMVTPKLGTESSAIGITCDNCPVVNDLRSTCRCVGGRLNGTVQESQDDCNIDLPDSMNPDKLSDAEKQSSVKSDICKPVTQPNGEPQTGCQADTGIRGHEDPDLDDNLCTHRAGYVPRGDVCADGRDNCLISYDVSDLQSTSHVNRDLSKTPAPNATDVTTGLDTYFYLTGGKKNKDGREYISWYRPRPPRIAAPDAGRSGTSANAQPVGVVDTFSIDGRPSGLIYYGGGQGRATIRFYAWAAHDQGPLKSIYIDWGDGTIQQINDTQMKNRKPVCNVAGECEFVPGLACSGDADCPPGAGACRERGYCKKQAYKECYKDIDCGNNDQCETRMFFGNSTEACQQGYFEFSHVYKCDETMHDKIGLLCDSFDRCEQEPDYGCGRCRIGEACVTGLAPRGGCYDNTLNRCRYTPRVMVLDNWGWCTGDCSQSDEAQPGGPKVDADQTTRHPYGGCWDGSDTKLNTEINKNDTLINECSIESYSQPGKTYPANYYSYRPWIVYDGSVEVSPPSIWEVEPDPANPGGFSFKGMLNNYSFSSGFIKSGMQNITP